VRPSQWVSVAQGIKDPSSNCGSAGLERAPSSGRQIHILHSLIRLDASFYGIMPTCVVAAMGAEPSVRRVVTLSTQYRMSVKGSLFKQ
jgi:hypothetical protein